MTYRYVAATLALWSIALVGTVVLYRHPNGLRYLVPLLGMCMISAVVVVAAAGRRARGGGSTAD